MHNMNFFPNRLPFDDARLKQWLVNMRRETSKWNHGKSRLCSSHFEEDQFFRDKQVLLI